MERQCTYDATLSDGKRTPLLQNQLCVEHLWLATASLLEYHFANRTGCLLSDWRLKVVGYAFPLRRGASNVNAHDFCSSRCPHRERLGHPGLGRRNCSDSGSELWRRQGHQQRIHRRARPSRSGRRNRRRRGTVNWRHRWQWHVRSCWLCQSDGRRHHQCEELWRRQAGPGRAMR